MASQPARSSPGVYWLGGVRAESRTAAPELVSRGQPRGRPRRRGPSPGHCLLRRLRTQDERAVSRSQAHAFSFVLVSARLSGRGRADLPEHEFASGGCHGGGVLSGSGFAAELGGVTAGAGAGGARSSRPTTPAGVAARTSAL